LLNECLCQRGFVRGAGLTVRGVLPILSYGDRAREPLGPLQINAW